VFVCVCKRERERERERECECVCLGSRVQATADGVGLLACLLVCAERWS
jgi:hypothetical protein